MGHGLGAGFVVAELPGAAFPGGGLLGGGLVAGASSRGPSSGLARTASAAVLLDAPEVAPLGGEVVARVG